MNAPDALTKAVSPRRAAALLIVILLLLLAAIIGTAFISTTQSDRASAIQHAENAQIDLYVDGMVNIAKSMVLNELFGGGSGNTPGEYRSGYPYRHYSAHSSSAFLATRVPQMPYTLATNAPLNPFINYNWGNLTRPAYIEYASDPVGTPGVFDDPLHDYSQYVFKTGNSIGVETVNGVDYPILQFSNQKPVLAGDADGDGMADTALWKLTKQPDNGVIYYGGMRIVDNCAAINVNTAWLRNTDHDAEGRQLGDNPAITPSNIGLLELLQKLSGQPAAAEMDAINHYRFGGTLSVSTEPTADGVTLRDDFEWFSQSHAFYSGLGSRIGNPGFNGPGRKFRPFTWADDAALAYRFVLPNFDLPPSTLENVIMAATEGLSSNKIDSLYKYAPNYHPKIENRWKQYARKKDANGNPAETPLQLVQRWWSDNFDYDSGRFSLRPLLVANNPVSQAIMVKRLDVDGDKLKEEPGNPGMVPYKKPADWNARTAYRLHEVVQYKRRYYASLKSNNLGAIPSGTLRSTEEWEFQPWHEIPQKASLNTSNFRELWRNFWCLMHASPEGSATSLDSSYGRPVTRYPTSRPWRRVPSPDPEPHRPEYGKEGPPFRREGSGYKDDTHGNYEDDRQLRSRMDMEQILDLPAMAGDQVAVLRSALAAVNTLGLREHSDDVISRTLLIHQGGEKAGEDRSAKNMFRATVFSNERQPVISEVLLQTKALNSLTEAYVAIEVFNPYPEPISLRNWHWGVIDRGHRTLSVSDLGRLSDLGVDEIGPRKFIVFESNPEDRPVTEREGPPATPGGEPTRLREELAVTGQVVTVPRLSEVWGKEIVLLRPRKADGTLTRSDREWDRYDEGTEDEPNLYDFVPIDQMDFFNLKPDYYYWKTEGAVRYNYARDTVHLDHWLFFYPGGYDRSPTHSFYESSHTTDPRKDSKLEDNKFNPPGTYWLDNTPLRTRHAGLLHPTVNKAKNDPMIPADEQVWGDLLENEPTHPPYPDGKEPLDPGGTPVYAGSLGRPSLATYSARAQIKLQHPKWFGDARIHDPTTGGVKNVYPYGLFARAGDVLKVPYIGAYTLWQTLDDGSYAYDAATLMEMNSVTMDAMLSVDAKSDDGVQSHCGRFAPENSDGNSPASKSMTFEYFTTLSHENDFMPNVHPDYYGYYDKFGNWTWLPEPEPIANTDPRRANYDEPFVGVQGLVNANTAPWIVLSQLPLLLETSGAVDSLRTVELAKEMARETSSGGRGSLFKSVLGVNQALNRYKDQDLRPWEREDFEFVFGDIMRLSNLLTVRSDSFTVYILVEGWRDPNTKDAKRILQRRVAFVVDRSAVSQWNQQLRVINIPID